MGKYFVCALSFFLLVSGFVALSAGSMPTQQQVEHIDQQIADLEDRKLGYEGRALRHDNLAEYQQFENHNYLEARRHMQLADEYRLKAAAVQKKIDALRVKRAALLQEEES